VIEHFRGHVVGSKTNGVTFDLVGYRSHGKFVAHSARNLRAVLDVTSRCGIHSQEHDELLTSSDGSVGGGDLVFEGPLLGVRRTPTFWFAGPLKPGLVNPKSAAGYARIEARPLFSTGHPCDILGSQEGWVAKRVSR
jgi:hypothetical protein